MQHDKDLTRVRFGRQVTVAAAADTGAGAALARAPARAAAAPARALAPATVAVDATAPPDRREAGRRDLPEVIRAPDPVRVADLAQASAAPRRILRIRANNRRPKLFFPRRRPFCRLLPALPSAPNSPLTSAKGPPPLP